jgi:putative beta-lysine N-acetyltransferase
MVDKIETIGKGSVIQHGKINDRIYLIKLAEEDCPGIVKTIGGMAREHRYSKIFGKVPSYAAPYFFSDGYVMEAFIPGFYNRREAAVFVSKYLSSDRLLEVEHSRMNELANMLVKESQVSTKRGSREKVHKKSKIITLDPSYVKQITRIYREVFLSYPFPIHNPGYILKTMKENVCYYGVVKKGTLMAVASAEIDSSGSNAEMTDFATLPDYRGNGLASRLLDAMEGKMKKAGIKTLYTIARLNSMPMNKTFLKLNYQFAGTLIKNTNIAGKIESMNVYYKHL